MAIESAELKNGIITYTLQEAFKDGQADINNDKIIDLEELINYIKSRVPELTKGMQKVYAPKAWLNFQIAEY
ncbi:MAG: hypothetical protein NVS3B19_15620 [Ginsengibacter sp.]